MSHIWWIIHNRRCWLFKLCIVCVITQQGVCVTHTYTACCVCAHIDWLHHICTYWITCVITHVHIMHNICATQVLQLRVTMLTQYCGTSTYTNVCVQHIVVLTQQCVNWVVHIWLSQLCFYLICINSVWHTHCLTHAIIMCWHALAHARHNLNISHIWCAHNPAITHTCIKHISCKHTHTWIRHTQQHWSVHTRVFHNISVSHIHMSTHINVCCYMGDTSRCCDDVCELCVKHV